MIKVEYGDGGLWLSRWNGTGPRPESFFVPADELPHVIAAMTAQAEELEAADDPSLLTLAADWDARCVAMAHNR